MIRLLLAVFLLLPVGCQHTRSILQMDSNSSSPFLGLQLSVDASEGIEKKNNSRQEPRLANIATVSRRTEVQPAQAKTGTVVASVARNTGFVSTAESRAQTSNLKYSLPAVNLEDNPREAAEVEDILSRISG